MREREAKLIAGRGFEVPAAADLAASIVSSTTESVTQHAIYYDTDDFRLTRAGASLRYRSDDGWTVKLPESRTASSLTRTELNLGGGPGEMPALARSLVRAFTRTSPLIQVATIDTERHKTQLCGADGERLAEIDDDTVSGSSARGPAHFREIEIELAEETPGDLLDEVVRTLREAGADQTRASSKIARVLGDAAGGPPDLPDAPELYDTSTVRDLVRAALINATQQLTAHDPALRITDDTEAVHKARVATRRLRSDLRTLRPILDQHRTEPLRTELRWLGGVLGRVRDADVLLAELERKIDELPDDQRVPAKRVLPRLHDARARDQAALRAALDSHRYARLLDWLVKAAADPPLGRVKPKTPAASIADDLAATSRKRFRKHVKELSDQPIDPDLHEARKRAKQARYAHELLAPVLGKRAENIAKRFEAVQELLGDHQDAVFASQWLADAARERRDPGIAFAAGEVAGLYLVDKQRARAEWPKARDRALET